MVTRHRLIRLAAGLSAVVLAGAACDSSTPLPRQPKTASKIPHHPDFKVLSRASNQYARTDFFTTTISSKASYQQVKDFYLRELGPQGWKLGKEEPLTYDGYGANARQFAMVREHETVTIGYAGENRPRFGNENFYIWHTVKKF
jgi:hypothetical protein